MIDLKRQMLQCQVLASAMSLSKKQTIFEQKEVIGEKNVYGERTVANGGLITKYRLAYRTNAQPEKKIVQ